MLGPNQMKRATHSIARRLAVAGGAGMALAMLGPGCIVHHDDDGCYGCYDPPIDEPYLATIDADHSLSTELGWGAGLFVEYYRGGLWNVWTSCDTERDGYYCYWDIYVTSYGYVDSVAPYDLEPGDEVYQYDASSLDLHFATGYFSDGVEFFTAPGELVEITAYLDGYYEGTHQYFVWFGNGVLHSAHPDDAPGAPRQPVTFLPDTP
jgi:hypothetical protein